MNGLIQLEALGRLRPVPRRRPHLSLQRGRRMGRGNWMLAGSDAGGHGAAVVRTPIETCELNDADPPAWLAPVRAKPRDRPAKRRDGRHGIGRRASRQSRKRLEPRRHRPSEIPAAATGWIRLIRVLRTGRCLRAQTLARPYRGGPSKAVTFVPRRKGRPVLTQVRKNHRIVGADNLHPHKHLAVEPDLAREVSGQRVGDFVVMGLMRHAMNSQGFVA